MLPTGERRHDLPPRRREPDRVEHFVDPVATGVHDLGEIAQVLLDAEVAVNRWRLRDIADTPAQLGLARGATEHRNAAGRISPAPRRSPSSVSSCRTRSAPAGPSQCRVRPHRHAEEHRPAATAHLEVVDLYGRRHCQQAPVSQRPVISAYSTACSVGSRLAACSQTTDVGRRSPLSRPRRRDAPAGGEGRRRLACEAHEPLVDSVALQRGAALCLLILPTVDTQASVYTACAP